MKLFIVLKLIYLLIQAALLSGDFPHSKEPLYSPKNNISFIGYLNNFPAFKEEETNSIFLFNDGLKLLEIGAGGVEPMYANNFVLIYKSEDRDYTKIIVCFLGDGIRKEFKISLKTNYIFSKLNGERVYFVEDGIDDTSRLFEINTLTGLESYVCDIAYYGDIIGEYLFYFQLSPNGYPMVDLWKLNLHDFSDKKKIIGDIFLHDSYIFPNGNYLLAYTFTIIKKETVIFDLKSKGFAVIDFDLSNSNYFAFSFGERIGFYHPKRHDFVFHDMPLEFSLKREVDR